MKELEQVVKRWQLIDFAQHSKRLWIEDLMEESDIITRLEDLEEDSHPPVNWEDRIALIEEKLDKIEEIIQKCLKTI